MNAEDYFTFIQSNITRRRNIFMIISNRLLTNEAKHFFSNRVVNVWNSLPSNSIDSITLTPFKNRLDKYSEFNPQLKYYSLSQMNLVKPYEYIYVMSLFFLKFVVGGLALHVIAWVELIAVIVLISFL